MVFIFINAVVGTYHIYQNPAQWPEAKIEMHTSGQRVFQPFGIEKASVRSRAWDRMLSGPSWFNLVCSVQELCPLFALLLMSSLARGEQTSLLNSVDFSCSIAKLSPLSFTQRREATLQLHSFLPQNKNMKRRKLQWRFLKMKSILPCLMTKTKLLQSMNIFLFFLTVTLPIPTFLYSM